MKKFIKKLAKKAEGFTLVELVVVIAILGILAGVAVPAYSGYLEKANKAADDAIIAHVDTVIQTGAAYDGKTAKDVVSSIELSNKKIKVTIDDDEAKVISAIEDFADMEDASGAFTFTEELKYYTSVTKDTDGSVKASKSNS